MAMCFSKISLTKIVIVLFFCVSCHVIENNLEVDRMYDMIYRCLVLCILLQNSSLKE
jgi:hypothetical protein